MRLRIVQPCHEDWDAMTPADAGRLCAACTYEVHDFSVMTERQARRLLAARAGERVCARVRVGPDGHAVFRPERSRVAPAAAALALAACAPHSPEPGRLAPAEEVEVLAAPEPQVVEIPEAPPAAEPCQPAQVETPAPATKSKKKPPPKRRVDDVMDLGYIDGWD